MNEPLHDSDVQEADRPIGKTIKRAIRRPRKTPPASDTLQGWAKSAVKSRNKS